MIKSDLLHVYYKVFHNQKYSPAFIISPGKRFESNICKRYFWLPSPPIVFLVCLSLNLRSKRLASLFQAVTSYLLQVNLQAYCLSFISIFVLVFTSIKPWIIHVTSRVTEVHILCKITLFLTFLKAGRTELDKKTFGSYNASYPFLIST